jgi:C1A family cysteine protease
MPLEEFVLTSVPKTIEEANELHNQFKLHFGKTYDTPEAEKIAAVNLGNAAQRVMTLNAKSVMAGSSVKFGLTRLSDLSPSELKQMLTYNPMQIGSQIGSIFGQSSQSAPYSKDWSTIPGAVSPVRSQGRCGSCWAWAAVGVLEGANYIQNGLSEPLSPESITHCAYAQHSKGCDGGHAMEAFEFAKKGVPREVDYPYTSGERGTGRGVCLQERLKPFTRVTEIYQTQPKNELILKEAVAKQPLYVIMDGTKIADYSSGIMPSTVGCNEGNHAVLAVGYGTDEKGNKYWKFKNSWGDDWGENGYFRLERTDSVNTDGTLCITKYPSYFVKVANEAPKPVDPNPRPVDPNPRPVDPNPRPVDPNPRPVDPNPKPVDPNPKPAPVQTLKPFQLGVYTCSASIG